MTLNGETTIRSTRVISAVAELLVHFNHRGLYLESAVFLALHDVEYDGGDDVETLTVADLVVPARVRQQDALQHGSVVIVVLATECNTACPM